MSGRGSTNFSLGKIILPGESGVNDQFQIVDPNKCKKKVSQNKKYFAFLIRFCYIGP